MCVNEPRSYLNKSDPKNKIAKIMICFYVEKPKNLKQTYKC